MISTKSVQQFDHFVIYSMENWNILLWKIYINFVCWFAHSQRLDVWLEHVIVQLSIRAILAMYLSMNALALMRRWLWFRSLVWIAFSFLLFYVDQIHVKLSNESFYTGLCTSVGRVHANIVLIGDPKQLDAVTKSDWSTKLGFKTSWFEQLFNAAMYKRNSVTGRFNQTYITQLIQNYRSHRSILKIPNELFYDDSLKAIATPGILNHFLREIRAMNIFHWFMHRNHPTGSGRSVIEKVSHHF